MKSFESSDVSLFAADWGTSSFRLYLLSDAGEVVAESISNRGVAGMTGMDFEGYLADEISKFITGPVKSQIIMCGMVGSNIGWFDAGYLDCPASPVELAAKRVRVPCQLFNAYIVPGLRCESPLGEPDFMRGEETQILGWLADADDRQRSEALLCLPGTHTKWVKITDGRVMAFNTSFTGALYSRLRDDGVLVKGDQQADEVAFGQGLALGLRAPVISQTLFSVRGRVLDGSLAASGASSFLSGLLVGSDARSAVDTWHANGEVTVIGERGISKRYCQALHELRVEARYCDGKLAVVRGLRALSEPGGASL